MHEHQGLLQVDHLKQPEIAKLLEEAKVVYSAGFFITACSEAILHSAEHCLANNKVYAIVRFAAAHIRVPCHDCRTICCSLFVNCEPICDIVVKSGGT
jgi:hypothetical protein